MTRTIRDYPHKIKSLIIWRWVLDDSQLDYDPNYDGGTNLYIDGTASNYMTKYEAKISLALNRNDIKNMIEVLKLALDEMNNEQKQYDEKRLERKK